MNSLHALREDLGLLTRLDLGFDLGLELRELRGARRGRRGRCGGRVRRGRTPFVLRLRSETGLHLDDLVVLGRKRGLVPLALLLGGFQLAVQLDHPRADRDEVGLALALGRREILPGVERLVKNGVEMFHDFQGAR